MSTPPTPAPFPSFPPFLWDFARCGVAVTSLRAGDVPVCDQRPLERHLSEAAACDLFAFAPHLLTLLAVQAGLSR